MAGLHPNVNTHTLDVSLYSQLSLVTMDSSCSCKNQYELYGFTGPIDVLTVDEATQALEEVCRELSVNPESKGIFQSTPHSNSDRFKLHLILPMLDYIAHHPLVIHAVQEALQTQDVYLWSSDINWKSPNSKGFFAPHQDATYAGLSPSSKCLTAWIALSDPIGETEGCLLFYPKSHMRGQIPHQQTRRKDPTGQTQITSSNSHTNNNNNNMLSMGQYILPLDLQTLECPNPVAIPLRAGQMTLHSFDTVHSSGPNQSIRGPRVGLALRYMDAVSVRQTKTRSKEMVTWISSLSTSQSKVQDQEHLTSKNYRFDLEPRLPKNPTNDDLRRMRYVRDEAIRREEANYFG
jgi:ectoine hydroxylase-related dioxygenase (phytanoyl-CoA dioxygenase family)